MKYKIIQEDTIKNLIEFLDEIQFDAAKVNTTEAHHQVNFCSWAIKELLNSCNIMSGDELKKGNKKSPKNPKKKSRDDYVEETFLDWNLPEMSDEDYEKLVDQFDAFLRGWEEEYNKKNPKKKQIKRNPRITPNILETMSLEEIEKELLKDKDLTSTEKFELYYDEHIKQEEIKNSFTLKQMMKSIGIKGYKGDKKKRNNGR